RNLSAGIRSPGKAANKSDDEPGGLARRLMATLKRSLNAEETKFVRKVQTVYKRCKQNRHITHWDFEEIGLRLGGYGWDALHIWPAFPDDEHEFWLYIAHAAQEHGARIPEFMVPITDIRDIEQILVRWRRAREVEKWKATLGNLRSQGATARPLRPGQTDLRLVIAEKEALLEWQRPNQATFEPIKAAQISQLAEEHPEGLVQFTTEAEIIW